MFLSLEKTMASQLLRSELAKRLKLRKIPDIEFVVDDTLEKVDRIHEIVHGKD